MTSYPHSSRRKIYGSRICTGALVAAPSRSALMEYRLRLVPSMSRQGVRPRCHPAPVGLPQQLGCESPRKGGDQSRRAHSAWRLNRLTTSQPWAEYQEAAGASQGVWLAA